MGRKRRLALGMFGLVLGMLPSPALGTEWHCVVEVVGVEPDGEMRMSGTSCFGELEVALAFASDGEASLDGTRSDESLTQLATTFALGIHFTGFNGTGSSITVVGGDCTGGYWNTGSSWANKISSSYHGCYRLVHYDLPNKGGIYQASRGTGSTVNLTTLNNKTESVSYHSN